MTAVEGKRCSDSQWLQFRVGKWEGILNRIFSIFWSTVAGLFHVFSLVLFTFPIKFAQVEIEYYNFTPRATVNCGQAK